MGKVSVKKSCVQYFHKYRTKGKISSEAVIIPKGQRMDTDPFKLLLVSTDPTE
jgi:hypothetical protein